jgi:hypothetical protein
VDLKELALEGEELEGAEAFEDILGNERLYKLVLGFM